MRLRGVHSPYFSNTHIMTPVEDDTETLLALVSSLLERSLPNQAEILAALADCNGDVDKAAASLNNKYSREKGKESQKRNAGLHGWLKDLDSVSNKSARPIKRARSPSPSEQISPTHVSSSNANGGSKSASTSSSSAAKVKAITNKEFISMFRPPSSSEGPSRPCPAKHPPLTLATPELVAKHTPCTLHTSILPQELACRSVNYIQTFCYS